MLPSGRVQADCLWADVKWMALEALGWSMCGPAGPSQQ